MKNTKRNNKGIFIKVLNIEKEKLYYLYWNKKLSAYRIARLFNCSNVTIYNKLKEYNIPRRTASEATKGKIGKIASNYKDGRTLKKCYCIDCSKELKSWQSVRCNSCANRITFSQRIRKPNKPEKLLINLLKKLLPKEYKYVGNFKFWIENFNPDFINCNGKKKIIELYGDYWHNREDAKKRDKLRLKAYKKYGYRTLIIWQHELKDIKNLRKKT